MNKEFITPKNLNIIYETLVECNFDNLQNVLKENNVYKKNEINKLFMININYFYENEMGKYNNTTLIELNKSFIVFMLKKGKFEFPLSTNNNTQYQKIHPLPQNIKLNENIPITSKDIQQVKLNEFTNELQMKKNEFLQDEIINKPPPIPNFKDDYEEEPLKNIDLNILISKRNNEIKELIYNTTYFTQTEPTTDNQNKHIQILEGDDNIIKNNNILKIVEISTSSVKENNNDTINARHVSWDEPLHSPSYYSSSSSLNEFKPANFLKKLKTLNEEPPSNYDNNVSLSFIETPAKMNIELPREVINNTPEEMLIIFQKKLNEFENIFNKMNDRLNELEHNVSKALTQNANI